MTVWKPAVGDWVQVGPDRHYHAPKAGLVGCVTATHAADSYWVKLALQPTGDPCWITIQRCCKPSPEALAKAQLASLGGL